ncbi:MAG: DUF5678 domain-containing protein [Candidatus ainarchaeum sp.]|nr:DUF5678 domain-containing protein [Candidatus ainarchaeum sp.]
MSLNTYEIYANIDLSIYAGEWVAMIAGAVVAHGKNVKELLKQAKEKHPGKTPFIAKVPSKEILIW